MKTKLITVLLSFMLMGFGFVGSAYAEETSKDAQSHEQHHPEGQTADKNTGKMPMGDQGGMMGKMDMKQMKGMMHECMEMNKDE